MEKLKSDAAQKLIKHQNQLVKTGNEAPASQYYFKLEKSVILFLFF